MAVAERDIKIIRQSPTSREERREKASFDSSMVIIRDAVRHATPDAGEYFFREMMREVNSLSRRFGLKIS